LLSPPTKPAAPVEVTTTRDRAYGGNAVTIVFRGLDAREYANYRFRVVKGEAVPSSFSKEQRMRCNISDEDTEEKA